MNLSIALLLTICFYMSIPFFCFFRKKNKYTSNYINKFNIINSLIAFILDTILVFILTQDGTLVKIYPPFIYYFINNAIWQRNAITSKNEEKIIKQKKQQKQLKENNKKNYSSKNLFYIFIFFIILFFGAFGIYEYFNNQKLKGEIYDLKKKINDVKFDYDYEVEHNQEYKEKAEYLDKNIVFIVDGYDNYYIEYLCLNYIDNPKGNVTLREIADKQGYQKYDCYNEIYESLKKDIDSRTYIPPEYRN